MCDDVRPTKYISLFHTLTVSDPDNIPLDTWMDANIPDDYRVVSIMQDKIVSDEITFSYHIVAEWIEPIDTTWTGGPR